MSQSTPCKITFLLGSLYYWILDVNIYGPHFGTVWLKFIYINHRERILENRVDIHSRKEAEHLSGVVDLYVEVYWMEKKVYNVGMMARAVRAERAT